MREVWDSCSCLRLALGAEHVASRDSRLAAAIRLNVPHKNHTLLLGAEDEKAMESWAGAIEEVCRRLDDEGQAPGVCMYVHAGLGFYNPTVYV